MLGDFAKRGWPSEDDYNNSYGSGEGGGDGDGKLTEEERLFKFRFKIPEPSKNPIEAGRPVTKRVLFLDSVPCTLFEHDLYKLNMYQQPKDYTIVCLKKNQIDERGCPLCDDLDSWAKYTGFFTIIDMGQVEFLEGGKVKLHHRFWTDRDGKRHYVPFERVMLAAKGGSKDKPGVLKTLQWAAERKGENLAGTVWDTTRGGDKSPKCGDTWEYVERIDLAEAAEYLHQYGADRTELNDGRLDVIDYARVFQPMSYEQLHYLCHGPSDKSGEHGGGSRTEGAGYGGDGESRSENRPHDGAPGPGYGGPDDDDIPF